MGLDTSRRKATLAGIPMGYLSLATLAVQNAVLILVMHYSRIMPLVDGHRYLASTAVFLNEAMKLSIAVVVAYYDARSTLESSNSNSTPAAIFTYLYTQVFSSDSWKLAIPAALYTLQNSLQYLAVSNLDAATFQVTYQLKILTTAVFSVTMLKRSLTTKKWISLVLLMAGVAVVQLPPPSLGTSSSEKATRALESGAHDMSRMTGLIAVVVACAISGLAGVYFEKVLKDGNQVSLWVRNVQLSFWSLFPAFFVGVVLKDGSEILRNGFFAGYNGVVWTAIVCQAVGGLLVALVVNYADNIAKNFATSISIIISCVASVWLFDFVVTANFTIGMCVVIYATYLYSSPDRRPTTTPADTDPEYREPNEGDVEAQEYEAERAPALAPLTDKDAHKS